ncbi:MAG: hypothetical protein GY710_09240 [Desulfobacteraceae bacterium]|nr:hypothetical protein [Desulfobacteraceae bacterium]
MGVTNMRVFLSSILIIGLIGIAGFSFAEGTKVPSDAISVDSQAKPVAMDSQDYKGVVINTENGLALMSGDIDYLLQGEKLEDLFGKTVSISGKLIKDGLTNTIIVAKVKVEETK